MAGGEALGRVEGDSVEGEEQWTIDVNKHRQLVKTLVLVKQFLITKSYQWRHIWIREAAPRYQPQIWPYVFYGAASSI